MAPFNWNYQSSKKTVVVLNGVLYPTKEHSLIPIYEYHLTHKISQCYFSIWNMNEISPVAFSISQENSLST